MSGNHAWSDSLELEAPLKIAKIAVEASRI
jgi:hypothetical protein